MQTTLVNDPKSGGVDPMEEPMPNLSPDRDTSNSGYPDFSSSEPVLARRWAPKWLRTGAPAWIWVGVTVVGFGFVLIAVAWGQVAAETQVHLQVPYVVSSGLVGLGVIMVGLTILNVVTRQRDAIDRDRQVYELVEIIEELRHTLAEQQDQGR